VREIVNAKGRSGSVRYGNARALLNEEVANGDYIVTLRSNPRLRLAQSRESRAVAGLRLVHAPATAEPYCRSRCRSAPSAPSPIR